MPGRTDPWLRQIAEWKDQFPLRYGEGGDLLKPQPVFEMLQEMTASRDDIVWTTGVGQHQMWAMQYLLCDRPRTFITSGGLGTMGYGIPAAVGAKAARPDATVVCIDGDGCFQMTQQELATSVLEDLPIVVVIVNNGYLGMVRQWQDMFFGERFSQIHLTQSLPDYAGLARAYGALGFTAETEGEVADALEEALASGRTAVVDARVDPARALLPDDPGRRGRARPRRVRRHDERGAGVIHTVSVLLENKPGALTRITSMFARRGYNIESLAVGTTERHDVSRITLRVDCAGQPLEQIEKQMHKLVNVLRVDGARPRRVDRARARAPEGDGAAERPRRADGAGRGLRRPRRRPRPGCDRVRADRPAGGRRLVRGARPAARPPGARPHRQDRPQPPVPQQLEASQAARSRLTHEKETHPMATIHRDGDLGLLDGKVAVVGFGSQGHAHALNLHDSGVQVQVGLRDGSSSRAAAEDAGLDTGTVADAVRGAQVVAMLVPDHVQKGVWDEDVAPNLEPGAAVLFAHGLNVHFGRIVPPAEHDVIMVAPKAPGHRVRELYVAGAGTPGLVAVHQDASGRALQLGLAYGVGIGCGRVGLLETTFAEETESDLFGEQAVLCGGVPALVQAGFDTLVEAGYQPEIAYYECLNELKLIVDLLYQGGYEYMRYSVSDVAEYGDLSRGPRIADDRTREEMRAILDEIRSGAFARELFADDDAGRPNFARLRAEGAARAQEIERVGKDLRELAGSKASAEAGGPVRQ